MKPYLALYLKELKDNRTLALSLLTAVALLDLYAWWNVDPGIFMIIKGLSMLILPILYVLASVFLLPFLLAHSFSSEWKSGTHYLMLSLPVRKFGVALCKYLAIVSIGVALFAATTAGVHLMYLKLLSAGKGIPQVTGVEFWLFAGSIYFPVLLLFLGLACSMEGVKFAVKRFRGTAAVGFFALGLYAYGKLMEPAEKALKSLGVYGVPKMVRGEDFLFGGATFGWIIYSVLAGLFFLILGLFLFEKYVEI